MKINITVSDKQYAEALGLTLARSLSAMVSIDGEGDADIVLCDNNQASGCSSVHLNQASGCSSVHNSPIYLAVSKFEPVTAVIDRIRSSVLVDCYMERPSVKTLAVTGRGGRGVSTVAVIMARLLARLYNLRVLLLSFDSLAGPGDAFIYQALARGKIDLQLLPADEFGVRGCQNSEDDDASGVAVDLANRTLNPLRRLTRSEMATLLSILGHSDAYDLIVMDVPLASSHWELAMDVSEKAVVVGDHGTAGVIRDIYEKETRGLGSMAHFSNGCMEENPHVYGELGASVGKFIQRELSDFMQAELCASH